MGQVDVIPIDIVHFFSPCFSQLSKFSNIWIHKEGYP